MLFEYLLSLIPTKEHPLVQTTIALILPLTLHQIPLTLSLVSLPSQRKLSTLSGLLLS